MTDRTVPRIAEDLDELVAGATDRVEVRTSDARSGARFERLVIDGERCFLKSLSAADDWIMRVTGNTDNWEFKVWKAGIYVEDAVRHRPHDPGDGPRRRPALHPDDRLRRRPGAAG